MRKIASIAALVALIFTAGCEPKTTTDPEGAPGLLREPTCATAAPSPAQFGLAAAEREGIGYFLIRTANAVCKQDIYRNIIVTLDAPDAPPDLIKSERLPWTDTVLTPFRYKVHNLSSKPITWIMKASFVTDTYGDVIGCTTKGIGEPVIGESLMMEGTLGGVLTITCQVVI